MFSQRPSTSGQLSRGASLSLVDSVLWFGGGVIGRLALNLLLAAFPACGRGGGRYYRSNGLRALPSHSGS
jgi:hypothetical protein